MATKVTQELEVVVSGDGGLQAVANSYNNINQAAANANQALQTVGGTTAQGERVARSAASAYDRLARSYDPLYASTARLNSEMRQLERAFRQGVITSEQYEQMLGRLRARHDEVSRSASMMGGAVTTSSRGLQDWQKRILMMNAGQVFQQAAAGGFTAQSFQQAAIIQGLDSAGLLATAASGMSTAAVAGGAAFAAVGAVIIREIAKGMQKEGLRLRDVAVGLALEAWDAIKSTASAAWEAVKGPVDAVGSAIGSIVGEAINVIGQVPLAAKVAFATGIEYFKAMPSVLGEAIIDATNKLISGLNSLLATAGNALTNNPVFSFLSSHSYLANVIPGGSAVLGLGKAAASFLPSGQFDQITNPFAGARDRANQAAASAGQQAVAEGAPGFTSNDAWSFLVRAGQRGKAALTSWANRPSKKDIAEGQRETERATDFAAQTTREAEALRDKSAAYQLERSARESALRGIERELELKNKLADLDKATPEARGKVESALRSKWAGEDQLRTASADATLRQRIADMQRETGFTRERGNIIAGTDPSDLGTALRLLERKAELERELANISPDASAATVDALKREIVARQDATDQLERQKAAADRLAEQATDRTVAGAYQEYFAKLKTEAKSFGQLMVSVTDQWTQVLSARLADAIVTMKLSAKELGVELLKVAAQMAIMTGIQSAMGAFGSAFLSPTPGSPAPGAPVPMAKPAVPSAMGNVFMHGRIMAFANGGVFGGPTLFPLGLAGEAGPEAIMPLRKLPSGRLGVEAANGGAGNTVNIGVHTTVNVPVGGGTTPADQQRIASETADKVNVQLQQMVDKRVAELMRPGSTLNRRRAY